MNEMNETNKVHDVIVIGGGPAGSTAAALLARKGHDVVLFEREKFPREHVGESLLPFCYWIFKDLGVIDQMRRLFVRKPGVRFINKDGSASTYWCFFHVIENESYLSFQVIRSDFDLMLLKNSERLGAKVHQQTKVKDVDLECADGGVTVTTVGVDGKESVHRARFLVDASGRDAFVGAKRGWRKVREELDRTAIWSHWDGVKLAGALEEGMSVIIYVGEEQKGWIWIFPLGPERVTAGFVAQNSYVRDQHKKLVDAGSKDWMQDLCMQELFKSPFAKSLLEGTKQVIPMQINGNYSYEVKNHFGTNYCMIGDARGFIDPIFSSGIFLSMKAATLVSEPIHAQLTGQVEAGNNPGMAHAYDLITGAYNFVHRMIRLFYNPHVITWAEVGVDGQIHKRHESAMAAGHFMLSGDFFENYKKYDKFFELLESPRAFEVYKEQILDKPLLKNPLNCESKFDEVIAEMVEADNLRRQSISPV